MPNNIDGESALPGEPDPIGLLKTEQDRITAMLRRGEGDKAELIRQRKEIAEKLRLAQAESLKAKHESVEKNKQSELVLSIESEGDRIQFSELLQVLSNKEIQQKYYTKLEGLLKNSNEVSRATGIKGLIFEMTRMQTVIEQGQEKVNFDLKLPGVDLDVPIERDGKPFIYETKAFPRMEYGSSSAHQKQLLKYEKLIQSGQSAGATVEIDGRINLNFLKWAVGENILDQGAIPNVELIYNFKLPSGKDFRFPLKKSTGEGLRFFNKDKDYTDEDRKVVNALERAILDRSILDIISMTGLKKEDDLGEFANEPMKIDRLEVFDRYQELRKTRQLELLLDRKKLVANENKRDVFSEYASEGAIRIQLKNMQDSLKQNPQMAKAKESYLLSTEEDFENVIKATLSIIESIKAAEEARRESSNEEEAQKQRQQKGWSETMPPEGISLDMDHILMDVIQGINKRAGQQERSYLRPERFLNTEEMLKKIEQKPSQRHIAVEIFDPIEGTIKQQNGKRNLERVPADLLRENIKRAQEYLSNRLNDESVSQQLRQKLARANIQLLSAIENKKHEIDQLKKSYGKQVQDAQELAKRTKDFSEVRRLTAEKQSKIFEINRQIEKSYIDAVGGSQEYKKIALQVSKIIDQDIAKFIYVVNSQEEIVMDEEVIRGDVSGRAAHSELAQGKNVYGAGEIVFSKHDRVFYDIEEWKRYDQSVDFNSEEWVLSEINNGSGHYRPNAESLRYVRRLFEEQGVDTSNAKLNDAILRGTSLRDLQILAE